MNAVMGIEIQSAIDKKLIYERLMKVSSGLKNDHVLACMLASQCAAEGDMPYRLGLTPDDYEHMMALHFPAIQLPMSFMAHHVPYAQRQDELEELSALLHSYAADDAIESNRMTMIIAAGCMGGNHLWQDMGLWSRKDLSALIQTNFPQLAAKNDKDMKWKKFFYKQLCIAEGIYICRSPSCEVCPDYSDCFGSEE